MTSPLGFIDIGRAGAWMRRCRDRAGQAFLAPGAPPAARVTVAQADVAEAVGVTFGTVSRWEAGKTQPTIEAFIGWSIGLGMNPGDALNELIEAAGMRRAE